MKIHLPILILLFTFFLTGCDTQYDPKVYFGENKGCFILHELYSQDYVKVTNSDCNKRYSPASTFKIPHSLIALETEAIKDPNQAVPWDGFKYWSKQWNKDHTLYSAMKYSAVPYFTRLPHVIGYDKIRNYLKEFGYGNFSFVDRIPPLKKQADIFWLNNELKISANEQIAFLKKMYENELDVQTKNLKIVKDSLVQKKGTLSNATGENEFTLKWDPKAIFSAKTGGTGNVGWLVGHINTEEKEYVFAFVTELGNDKLSRSVTAANKLLNDIYLSK